MKILFLVFSLFCSSFLVAQGVWTQKGDMPVTIPREGAVGFSIGIKGYVCTGANMNDVWEWNANNDTWIQKANFGGGYRQWAVGFSIGTKGYLGTGFKSISPNQLNDFWEYDVSTDTWTQKANVPGLPRKDAVGFAIDSLGYIGMGSTGTVSVLNDFYQYSPATNSWMQKSNFPGCARSRAFGLTIGNKGYIGFGEDTCTGGSFQKDLWEYNPVNNSWSQKIDFPGSPRSKVAGFSVGGKGYFGTGWIGHTPLIEKDFWEFDPSLNSWTQVSDFSGGQRFAAVGFSIGNKGYLATGSDGQNGHWDIWEFAPSPAAVTEQNKNVSVTIFPNPFYQTTSIKITLHNNLLFKNIDLKIYNLNGQEVTDQFSSNKYLYEGNIITITMNNHSNAGTYYYILTEDYKTITTGKLITL